jgi:RimJ/RimL family protein N-acetyltransferase
VLALCGDGGMQMNIQELGLVAREHIPVKVIVLNNRSLGMIRQFQEQYFDSRFVSTVVDYAAPDFCAISAAYGLRSRSIESEDDLSCLKSILSDGDAAVIEIMLPQDTHVYPKLSVYHPIEEQEPALEVSEWMDNMIVPPYESNDPEIQDVSSYRQFIRDTFDSLKRKRAEDMLWLLPIQDDEGNLCGYLRPVTADYRESLPGCAAQLCRWRNENQAAFSAEPFTANLESTERWLDELVLAREDRILFLIATPDGHRIGHIGFSTFSFDSKRCEVDAVLRGEKKGFPGMMTFALRSLIQWGLEELKLSEIRLRVFSDNQRAIVFYRKNGFVAEDTPDSGHTSPDRHYMGMRLDLDAWTKTQDCKEAKP